MVLRKGLVAVLVALLLILPGCAGSRVANERKARQSTTVGTGGMVAQLNLPAESDASIGGLTNYNPYAPKQQTKTWLYEPLMIQNSLDCEITPWLATSFKWQGANKLTFDIRPGVKWTDGSELTAKDVAFTFYSVLDPKVITPHRGYFDALVGFPELTNKDNPNRQVRLSFLG